MIIWIRTWKSIVSKLALVVMYTFAVEKNCNDSNEVYMNGFKLIAYNM